MKTKKRNKGKIIFIILCIFFCYALISGIVNFLSHGYDCPLYISKEFTVERNGEGRYTFRGEIVNQSQQTLKVEGIHMVAYGDIDAFSGHVFGLPCTYRDGFAIGCMENVALNQELKYLNEADASECDKQLFPNGATFASVSTVICKLEDGTEYTLKSHGDVEDEKASNLWMITMGSIGFVTLSIIYIIKRVRTKK